MAEPNKTTGITAEERRLRSERLKSRLMGICEDEIARLEAENSRHKEQNAESKKHLDAIATVVCRREGQHGWTYVPCTLADEIRTMRDENSRLTQELDEAREALRRNRQGLRNILELRKLAGSDRYGALTREEIESSIAEINAVLTRTQSTPVAERTEDNGRS